MALEELSILSSSLAESAKKFVLDLLYFRASMSLYFFVPHSLPSPSGNPYVAELLVLTLYSFATHDSQGELKPGWGLQHISQFLIQFPFPLPQKSCVLAKPPGWRKPLSEIDI